MRLVAISDTHCRLRKVTVPSGDLLIHAGDLTFRGDILEISQELRELGRIAKNFTYGCVLTAGNHDFLAERNPDLMKQMCDDQGLVYLDHQTATVGGFQVFGSAYSPEFNRWAFNVPRGPALKFLWDQIPDDTQVLVTHGPPMGILDPVERYNNSTGLIEVEHVGCADLYARTKELKQLKLHVFGHIHLGYGVHNSNELTYVNASVCNEQYKPTNTPIVLDLT